MQTLKSRLKNAIKRGDTIIEVTLALTVFSLISVISIQLMDKNLAIIQGTLESEMARNEIDAQAEALRFIQNSYLSERELAKSEREFEQLWLKLSRDASVSIEKAGSGLANDPATISQYTSTNCSTYYEEDSGTIHSIFTDRAFVVNTRKLDPTDVTSTIVQTRPDSATKNDSVFVEAELYPRVIFTKGSAYETNDKTTLSESEVSPAGVTTSTVSYDKVARAEGIWVISARAKTTGPVQTDDVPEFYDFHIRTCWFAPGHDRPSTIATTIRLYNPELIEAQR